MIKDIPNSDEYKDAAIECLIQAYNNIYNVDNGLNNETLRVAPKMTKNQKIAANF